MWQLPCEGNCRLQQEHELGAAGAGAAITVEGWGEPCLGQGALGRTQDRGLFFAWSSGTRGEDVK